jgi:23S rRNA pseudouridine2605 synthase
MKERLHKLLAAGGFGSRRQCEQLIRLGEVEVDGKIVTETGIKVDPAKQKVRCDGRYLKPQKPVTLLLNKPRGYLCTSRDEQGRRTVFALLHGVRERLYTVGRLDAESQGLLLLTNDGELCNLLTHPRYQVPRTYHVLVRGALTDEKVAKLGRGVWLSEGKSGPIQVRVKHRERDKVRGETTVLEVTVREGMNREVRRIFARLGMKVKRLKRIRFGPFSLGPIGEGRFRILPADEVERLKRTVRAATKGERHAEEE